MNRTAPAAVDRFTKRYPSERACRTAAANHRWLAGLDTELRLPRLLHAGARHLDFEYIHGRHPTPDDLVALAAHLGGVHGGAHKTALRRARLDRPQLSRAGHRIPDFIRPRVSLLTRRLASGTVPSAALDAQDAVRLLLRSAAAPAALYKDANPRNYLLTAQTTVTVDTDDVTLAPFGYDLAKLIVTLAMTHGRLTAAQITAALTAYNTAARSHQPRLPPVRPAELLGWAEIHHILTHRYLGSRGYRHSWHTVRPPFGSTPEEP